MADSASALPPPNPEQRRIAVEQFERARQVIATGNFDYGIQLLQTCCKIDPANLNFRKALRHAQKGKHNNNLRGSRMALLTNSTAKAKLKAAKGKHPLRVLEIGEDILVRNPWDLGTQMDMAEAAGELGLLDVAVWILEQARQKDAKDPHLNRALARLYERRGNFAHAIKLWEVVRQADPADVEAANKSKDLAASETIARGQYAAATGSKSDIDLEPESQPEPDPRAGAPASSPRLAPEAARPTNPRLKPTADTGDRVDREAEPLRARVAANPTLPSPYIELATHYRRAGHLDDARQILQDALGPTGQHYLITTELLELEVEPFRHNLAITDEKLRHEPDDNLRKLRMRLLKEINARELELYRLKAERFPTDLSHRLELGLRLLRAGRSDEAIPELQQARKDTRHQWRALMYLGHCFKQRHNWKLAQRNFEEALPLVPATEEAHRKEVLFQLASGLAEAGELARAIELGLDLANIDFGYRDIGRLIDEWQARLQQA
jgi:tetratricopeptide (TPR) repeat protein